MPEADTCKGIAKQLSPAPKLATVEDGLARAEEMKKAGRLLDMEQVCMTHNVTLNTTDSAGAEVSRVHDTDGGNDSEG